MAAMILRREGLQVLISHDGPSALDISQNWDPDAILLDLMLPGMNGFEICRKLREQEKTAKTPIIIVSARDSIEDKVQGFDAGADDYMVKPFNNIELIMRVKAQLRRSTWGDDEQASAPGSVISLFSLRGGTGCSSLAVNLAITLSQLWGVEVPLIDLSSPIGSCDVLLDVRPSANIGDIAQMIAEDLDYPYVQEVMSPHPSGVLLLGGTIEPEDAELVTPTHVTQIVSLLKSHYPYIVVDTSHQFSAPTLAALDLSDTILLPVSPDFSAVRVTYATLKTFEKKLEYEPERLKVVVNQTVLENGLQARRIGDVLNRELFATIPYDANWVRAINRGQPIMMNDRIAPQMTFMEDIAWKLSRREERANKPDNPTQMWMRVVRRWRQASSS
jgi:pilus assembly protein CpaE